MNKLHILIITTVILIVDIGIYSVFQPPPTAQLKTEIPYYFIAIHNEPEGKDYIVLKQMVEMANEYNIKVTLMFTAQWVDYILESPQRIADLESWKRQRHEIAAHHHSIYHLNWDGYSDYSKETVEAQKISQGKTPEKYIGTLKEFINHLRKINPEIKSGCVNDEGDKNEMPDEIIYDTCSGFANYGEVGRMIMDSIPEKGKNEYITVGTWKGIKRKWLTHHGIEFSSQIKAQEVFNSMTNSEVYGVIVHSMSMQLESYSAFLKFLHSKDPTGKRSKTVSEIIEQKLLPEKMISKELLKEKPTKLPLAINDKKCGDGICDEFEKANPNLCPKDCK